MGLFRKITAVSTMGIVSPRSTRERERIASVKESKANAKLARAQARALRRSTKRRGTG